MVLQQINQLLRLVMLMEMLQLQLCSQQQQLEQQQLLKLALAHHTHPLVSLQWV
jgi:hypothetical protein